MANRPNSEISLMVNGGGQGKHELWIKQTSKVGIPAPTIIRPSMSPLDHFHGGFASPKVCRWQITMALWWQFAAPSTNNSIGIMILSHGGRPPQKLTGTPHPQWPPSGVASSAAEATMSGAHQLGKNSPRGGLQLRK